MSNQDHLFAEFPKGTKEAWLKKIEQDLKGKPFSDLKWPIEKALLLDPFYHTDDQITGSPINRAAATNDWQIGASFQVDDAVATNKALLYALENGLDAPCLIFKQVPSLVTFEQLFKGIIPEYIYTCFSMLGATRPGDYSHLLETYHAYLQKKALDSTKLRGGIKADYHQQISLVCQRLFPAFHYIDLENKSSTNTTIEVSDTLLATLKNIDQVFQSIEAPEVKNICLSVEMGTSYFVEIAKIRALRILWAHLLAAYEVEDCPLFIDAKIAHGAYDKQTNTNMIRSMSIAMSAVIGGVDRLTIQPADTEASALSNRIARNVQHLLKMESYLHRVIDPAAGSFYIEKLTQLLVQKTWDDFLKQ